MSSPWDEFKDLLDSADDEADDDLRRYTAGLRTAAAAVGSTITPMDPVTGAVINAAGPIAGGLIDGQADQVNGYVHGAADVANGYVHSARDLAHGYVTGGSDLAHGVTGAVNDQVNSVAHAGNDLVNGVASGNPLGGLFNAGGDLAKGQLEGTAHLLTGVGHAAADIGTAEFKSIGDTISGLAKGAGDVATGTVKALADVGHGAAEGVAHGLESLAGFGGESKDEILAKFGHEDPQKVSATQDASKNGKAQLQTLASQINSGDVHAVATADEILRPGEAGLAYFDYFQPAYELWIGACTDMSGLKTKYEQEFGMNFADFAADADLLDHVATRLTDDEQTLENAYNSLIPSWQGAAASNFYAKGKIFFAGATTTQHTTSEIAAEVKSLVEGLQKVVLAKAQIVSNIYADTLPPGIDGAMAQTIAQVAKGELHDDMRRVVLGIFGLAAHGRHFYDDDGYYSSDDLDDPSRQAAINAAAAWCNQTLIPQTETRRRAVEDACAETEQRVKTMFAKIVSDVTATKDPFAGMETASAPTPKTTSTGSGPGGTVTTTAPPGDSGGQQTTPQSGPTSTPRIPTTSPTGTPGSTTSPSSTTPTPGVPTVTTPTPGVPTSTTTTPGTTATPGVPTGSTPTPGIPNVPVTSGQSTTPQSDPPSSVLQPGTPGTAGTPGTPGTPSSNGSVPGQTPGLPTDPGSVLDPPGDSTKGVWIPRGVPLPKGWQVDPKTGEALPPGWRVNPRTGEPVQTRFLDLGRRHGDGAGPGHDDVHRNKNGSLDLGPDHEVTISREHGADHTFRVTETDPDGTRHTYRVHFDDQGRPVAHEIATHAADSADPVLNNGADTATTPAGDTGSSLGSGLGGGDLGLGLTSGVPDSSLPSDTPAVLTDAGHPDGNPAAGSGTDHGTHLQDGTHVGADNVMGATSNGTPAASPVAGSAGAAAAASGEHGGVGGFPLGLGGGGRGAGGGGGEEAARKYAEKGDLVGEDELREWQRMGPVIGER